MSVEKKFNSVIKDHDLYEGFAKDGLLISEKYKSNGVSKEFLFIIGLSICYDDVIYFGDYNKFGIIVLSDIVIKNCYINLFGNKKFIEQYNISIGKLLYDILRYNDIERLEIIQKYLCINNFPILNSFETQKLIDKTWNNKTT